MGEHELSTRSVNCLKNAGLSINRKAVRDAILADYGYGLLMTKNLGPKSFDEICKWAGVKWPEKTKDIVSPEKPRYKPCEGEVRYFIRALEALGYTIIPPSNNHQ